VLFIFSNLLIIQLYNPNLLKETMKRCFQKVPIIKPPRDIYTRLEAFVF